MRPSWKHCGSTEIQGRSATSAAAQVRPGREGATSPHPPHDECGKVRVGAESGRRTQCNESRETKMYRAIGWVYSGMADFCGSLWLSLSVAENWRRDCTKHRRKRVPSQKTWGRTGVKRWLKEANQRDRSLTVRPWNATLGGNCAISCDFD